MFVCVICSFMHNGGCSDATGAASAHGFLNCFMYLFGLCDDKIFGLHFIRLPFSEIDSIEYVSAATDALSLNACT